MIYRDSLQEYQTSPMRFISSIDVCKLKSFKEWSSQALIDKQIVIPLLICKMIRGDIFALSAYDKLKKISGDNSLVIDYTKIIKNAELSAEFSKYGGAEDSRAVLTAVHWLASDESISMLGQNELGHNSLCLVNSILHIHNQHLNCD